MSRGREGFRRDARAILRLAAVAVTPETLTAHYWRRPDLLTAGAIASYAPKFGTGTLVQATALQQPVKVDTNAAFGNKPTVNWVGSDDVMTVATTYVIPLKPFTAIWTMRRTGASTYLGGQLSATSGRYFQMNPTSIRLEEGVNTRISDAITTANAASYAFSVATDGTVKFWVNGVQVGADQNMPTTAAGAAGTHFAGDPGGPGYIGEEAEFSSYARVLTSAEMLSHHADYVAPRYGL